MNANRTDNRQWDERIIQGIGEMSQEEFLAVVDELHPYDLANIYGHLDDERRALFVSLLPIEQVTDLVEELERKLQIDVLTKLGADKLAQVMDLMDNDDLASLLEEVDDERRTELLARMGPSESYAVRRLMQYPPETAGRIMTDRYVWLPQHYTVEDVMAKLREYAAIAETINYLYVIDDRRRLIGVLSYRDLILAEPGERIVNIMHERVIFVHADADQEEAARMIERYNFLALPVVDHDQRLVGIITVDDILDVVIREATEDIERLSASGKAIDFNTRAPVAAMRRLPWLVLLLLIGIVSGSIISGFEDTLASVVALAFFMPMIAGMTGNTGTQSLAVVVRGLTVRDIDAGTVQRLVIRELLVGILLGLVCGVLIAIIAYVWQGNLMLGLVVGCSLSITLVFGTLTGTVVPIVLYRLNIDPAIASGPLITTLNDILSLLIYFGIATAFLAYLT
jgi:magnesium transporter